MDISKQENKEYDFASSMQPMLGQQNLVKNALQDLALDTHAIEEVMTYAATGIDKHRTIFIDWLASKNIHTAAETLVFTQGAQQGIYTCLQILTHKEDFILHEELAYPGFFRAVDACGLKPLAVPLTKDGLDTEALEHYCQQHRPKVLYITPNMQNPTNIRYTAEVLEKIVALSQQYDFYIIEDDVNYCLPEDWRTPLQQLAADRVFYVSSLSKYVAGGLRIAFTLVPEGWQKEFNLNLHSQCWMVSTINIELASRFLMHESFQYNQELLAQEMRYRQKRFMEFSVKHHLEATEGGLNVWLKLPPQFNMNQLSGYLNSKNIKVRTADLFNHPATTPTKENAIRMALGSFTYREEFDQALTAFESSLLEFISHQQEPVI
ncbi:PLP-dependent aminotransferase family protein [Reinekea thalattae]|nr:PLP-dependent aminotransferase family protein [Reinekea thalattae]